MRRSVLRKASVAVAALAALASAVPVAAEGPAEAPRAIYVVRHAEKERDGRDPALDAAGRTRAEALARTLADAGLDAIYSTPFRRTVETAQAVLEATEGTADGCGGPELIETPYGGDPQAFVDALATRIFRERAGGVALVVGHSNTVPATLAALGVADPPELTERDYDDLFVVTFDGEGAARLLHLHYGAPSP